MTAWTEEKVRSLSVHQRHELWKNAKRLGAHQLIEWIEGCGLPYSDGTALSTTDPLFIKMTEVIFSDRAKQAALEATSLGLPALAGIDPILFEVLGVDYGPHNQATNNAGYIVAEMMRSQGYRKSGRTGPLPQGSVAKTAVIYVPNE